ncbi:pur operon repressor [Weissella viridescens]|uniref:Pur operon repressor n=1 Tax=Weissella viridescens TaxID=1629 RepID=A0A380P6S0_WEIVI|nr:pur operon repressor [Weissella viridescens]
MKTRRSDRLVDMTYYLLERPRTLVSLTHFQMNMKVQSLQFLKILVF